MKRSTGFRTFVGFAAAWAISIAVAFASGCLYAIRMESGHVSAFISAAAAGNKDALELSFFVGTTVAIAAAAIAFLAMVFIAWPLYLISRKRQRNSLRAYLFGGLVVALVVTTILLVLQNLFHDIPAAEYWFEIATIMLAGTIGALTFWAVAHPKYVEQSN